MSSTLQRLMLVALLSCCGAAAFQPIRVQAAEASFDCAKAQSDTEWAICNTPTLAAWDARMAALYAPQSANAGARQGQRDWVRIKRDPCGGRVGCLMDVYEVRLRDLEGPKGAPLKPVTVASKIGTCSPSDISILETGKGDAGMSKASSAYLIRYTGKGRCVLRGYPAITVHDSSGAVQIAYAVYAGQGAYVRFPGPPRSVTLSAKSSAWFSLSSSSGCDAPNGKPGFDVDVSLPLSTAPLKRIRLPSATCGAVTVTAIGPTSAMDAALNP